MPDVITTLCLRPWPTDRMSLVRKAMAQARAPPLVVTGNHLPRSEVIIKSAGGRLSKYTNAFLNLSSRMVIETEPITAEMRGGRGDRELFSSPLVFLPEGTWQTPPKPTPKRRQEAEHAVGGHFAELRFATFLFRGR